MLAELRTGLIKSADGGVNPGRADITGALVTSEIHGKYFEAVIRGNAYILSVASAAPTAYVGAAGGSPLLAVHNPINSGKALVILAASGTIRVTASGAGTTDLVLWAGISVIPTGTVTPARNLLTYVAAGASGLGFSNTALTGSTALNLVIPLSGYYWATAAAASYHSNAFNNLEGLIVIMPGMQVALGATVVPTSTTWDASLIWEEIQL